MNFYRRMLAAVALTSSALLSLSGCSSEVVATSFDAQVVTSTKSNTVPADKGSIEQQIVEALQSACPDLSPFASDPTNWVVISEEAAGAPYRMTLDGGDGGYIVLWFTPGDGEANLRIDEEYFEETNAVLYYSGCETLAENPDLDVQVGSGEQTVEVELIEVPNFVGALQLDADRWFGRNATQVKVGHRFKYGWNPKTSCMVTGDGLIIGQSPTAGSSLENSNSKVIVLEVDCEW